MRVVLAPDSFKGTITAAEVVVALDEGWRSVDPAAEIVGIPMADGGEGTLAAFAAAVDGAQRVPVRVTGPSGAMVAAHWLRLPPTPDAPRGTGVVELASTSGIELLTRLDAWGAHTLGCGQAIAAALDAGVSRLIIGIGSSASTDGGSGLLRALGAEFLNAEGEPVALGARGLEQLARIDVRGLRPPVDTVVITDVTNPLTGPAGAAHVFGPQKGLGPAETPKADAALARYAQLLADALGQDPGIAAACGAGAAGGVGFGLMAWGATLLPGAAEVAALVDLETAVQRADLVITGEGSFDGQTGSDKVPGYVRDLAVRTGVPVAIIAGRIAPNVCTDTYAAAISLAEIAGSTEAAMTEPRSAIVRAGSQLAQLYAGSPHE